MHHIGSLCPGRYSIWPLLFSHPLSRGRHTLRQMSQRKLWVAGIIWMDGWISPDGVKYRAAYSAKNDMKQPKFLPSYRNWPLCKEEESWKVLRKVLFANKIWHWQLWPTESGREVGTKRCTCVNVTKCHRQYIFSGQCHQRQILPFVWYFWVSLSTMTNVLWHWHQKIYWKLQNKFFVILAPENILRIKRQLSYLSCIFRCQSHQNVIVMKIFLYLSFYQPNLRNGEEKNETCKKKKVEGMAIHERCIRWWFHSDQIQRHTYTSIYIEPSLWGYLSCLQHTTRQKGNLQNMGVLTTFIVFLDSSALFSNRWNKWNLNI